MTRDHIRIEGNGDGDTGRSIRVYRNGELIPNLTHVTFDADVNGVQKLTLTEIVILDAAVGIEEATQALEEREAIWEGERKRVTGFEWVPSEQPREG